MARFSLVGKPSTASGDVAQVISHRYYLAFFSLQVVRRHAQDRRRVRTELFDLFASLLNRRGHHDAKQQK